MNRSITLRDIAGYCPEEAIWKMITDLGQSIKDDNNCPVSPDGVIIDGMTFLTDEQVEKQNHFQAPECSDGATGGQAQQVWALGALIYYASSGRTLFGGHGGAYQKNHPNVLLPSLRKSHDSLTAVMQQCLQHEPSSRIGIDKLIDEARKGLETCRKAQRSRSKTAKAIVPTNNKQKRENWPEEMKETI